MQQMGTCRRALPSANFSSTLDSTLIDNLDKCRRDDIITSLTNGGSITFDKYSRFKSIPDVTIYYNPTSVAT
eukprot:2896976-Ditylum_brightwellii.AAC.1